MSKPFNRGGIVRMCSYNHTPEDIPDIHQRHLNYYKATSDDCELLNVTASPPWDAAHCHYQLHVKTYLGWKVYMLHTGCFASIPEYEEKGNETT